VLERARSLVQFARTATSADELIKLIEALD
jgi:hypothetical protein